MKKENKTRIFLGITAILFYFIHGGYLLIRQQDPSHLLWACHLGAAAVGLGLLFRRSPLFSTGVLWLGLGNMMWMLYLIGKGEFVITSVLTHLGAFFIGLIAIYKIKMPITKNAWLWAVAGMAALQQLCRWITNETENVNLAFRVHEGWEKMFPSYGWYLVVLFFTCAIVFFLLEIILKKLSLSKSAGDKKP